MPPTVLDHAAQRMVVYCLIFLHWHACNAQRPVWKNCTSSPRPPFKRCGTDSTTTDNRIHGNQFNTWCLVEGRTGRYANVKIDGIVVTRKLAYAPEAKCDDPYKSSIASVKRRNDNEKCCQWSSNGDIGTNALKWDGGRKEIIVYIVKSECQDVSMQLSCLFLYKEGTSNQDKCYKQDIVTVDTMKVKGTGEHLTVPRPELNITSKHITGQHTHNVQFTCTAVILSTNTHFVWFPHGTRNPPIDNVIDETGKTCQLKLSSTLKMKLSKDQQITVGCILTDRPQDDTGLTLPADCSGERDEPCGRLDYTHTKEKLVNIAEKYLNDTKTDDKDAAASLLEVLENNGYIDEKTANKFKQADGKIDQAAERILSDELNATDHNEENIRKAINVAVAVVDVKKAISENNDAALEKAIKNLQNLKPIDGYDKKNIQQYKDLLKNIADTLTRSSIQRVISSVSTTAGPTTAAQSPPDTPQGNSGWSKTDKIASVVISFIGVAFLINIFGYLKKKYTTRTAPVRPAVQAAPPTNDAAPSQASDVRLTGSDVRSGSTGSDESAQSAASSVLSDASSSKSTDSGESATSV